MEIATSIDGELIYIDMNEAAAYWFDSRTESYNELTFAFGRNKILEPSILVEIF